MKIEEIKRASVEKAMEGIRRDTAYILDPSSDWYDGEGWVPVTRDTYERAMKILETLCKEGVDIEEFAYVEPCEGGKMWIGDSHDFYRLNITIPANPHEPATVYGEDDTENECYGSASWKLTSEVEVLSVAEWITGIKDMAWTIYTKNQ